jgi:hypothetical protein
MKKKLLFCFLFLFRITHIAFAQINDAQVWENVNVEKIISQKFSARINQEGRITENFSRLGFSYLDVGVNYKINKHIHATLAYVWVEKKQLDDTWSARHQAYIDFTFRKKIKGFLVADRQMFLWQVKDYFSSATGRIPDYYLRNKITIRWDKTFKFQPYAAAEIYYRTYGPNDSWQFHFNRIRYFAGVFYHPNLINEFEAYYLIEHHFNIIAPPTNWVIGLGYTHTF